MGVRFGLFRILNSTLYFFFFHGDEIWIFQDFKFSSNGGIFFCHGDEIWIFQDLNFDPSFVPEGWDLDSLGFKI